MDNFKKVIKLPFTKKEKLSRIISKIFLMKKILIRWELTHKIALKILAFQHS